MFIIDETETVMKCVARFLWIRWLDCTVPMTDTVMLSSVLDSETE